MRRIKPSHKIFYKIILLILSSFSGKGQDIHFSQFFEAPLLRNPSLAGIYTGDIRVQGVYRTQWTAFTDAYKSGSFNAEYKMPLPKSDDFITAGFQFLFDRAGRVNLSASQIMPAINYHKSLSNEKTMYLSFGVMGGMLYKTIDVSKMTTDNQYQGSFNPGRPIGENNIMPSYLTWDADAGISFNESFGADEKNSLFLGAAYHHLNRPKNSFYKNAVIEINPKYVFSAGIKLRMDDYSYFIIQADQSFQGNFSESIGGALYSYQIGDDPDHPLYTLHGGAFLRWKDALIPVLKIDKHPLSIAISYDVNVSPLKTASMGRGGFELSVSYIGFLNRGNSSLEKVICPRF